MVGIFILQNIKDIRRILLDYDIILVHYDTFRGMFIEI